MVCDASRSSKSQENGPFYRSVWAYIGPATRCDAAHLRWLTMLISPSRASRDGRPSRLHRGCIGATRCDGGCDGAAMVLRWSLVKSRLLARKRSKMADAMAVMIAALADDDSLFPDIDSPEGGNIEKKRAKVQRSVWVKPWIQNRTNDETNTMYKLQKELEVGFFL